MKISLKILLILIYQTVSEELNSDKDAFCKKDNLENDPNLSKHISSINNKKTNFLCLCSELGVLNHSYNTAILDYLLD